MNIEIMLNIAKQTKLSNINKTINEFLRWSKAFDESNYKKFNL